MKKLLLAALFSGIAGLALGQTTDTTKKPTDTTKRMADTAAHSWSVHYGGHFSDNDTSRHHYRSYPRGFIGITLSRFDLGLAKLVDNGSLTLQPQNKFLNYRAWKTSNVGFDVFQMGERFSNNFRIYLSAGFDWTLIRLEDNITILKDQPVLSYKVDNVDYSKNRFSSSYLRVPLSFDFRTNEDRSGTRWHFVLGPDGGVLLGGMMKQISEQYGKQKFYNPYNYANFRYGGFVRAGYGDFGLFAKYYVNNMFQNSPEQDGLRNFSFGIMLGF
jgi:hypothetical protein